jgi:DNA-binding transcriptional ArsR family regulator
VRHRHHHEHGGDNDQADEDHGLLPSVAPGQPAAGGGRFPGPARRLHRQLKTSNIFLEVCGCFLSMASWSFLSNHGRVLLCIARDPGVRLRDIAASAGITERSAYGIVTDLAEAGYVVKQKDGRRNRYQIQDHLPVPEPASRELAIGEVLALLAGPRA